MANLTDFFGHDIHDENDSGVGQLMFWTGTRAEYDAITTPDPDTIYNITDDGGGTPSGGGGVTTFLQLTDTPTAFGTPGQAVVVNTGGNGLAYGNIAVSAPNVGSGILPDNVEVGNQNATSGLAFWTGTQAQYDALTTRSSNTLYFITTASTGGGFTGTGTFFTSENSVTGSPAMTFANTGTEVFIRTGVNVGGSVFTGDTLPTTSTVPSTLTLASSSGAGTTITVTNQPGFSGFYYDPQYMGTGVAIEAVVFDFDTSANAMAFGNPNAGGVLFDAYATGGNNLISSAVTWTAS